MQLTISRYYLIVLLSMITVVGFAQPKPLVSYVDLLYDLAMAPANRLFSVDSLADMRTDTSSRLGTLQKSSGKLAEVRFRNGFLPTLTNVVFMTIPNLDDKFTPYTLLIHEFEVAAQPGTARLALTLTFARRDSARQLRPVFRAEIDQEGSTYLPDLFKQSLTKAFFKFNEYLANPSTVPPRYSDADLEAANAAEVLGLSKTMYPEAVGETDDLLRSPERRVGIYQNFDDLRRNRPSLTGQLNVEALNGFATLRKPNGSKARFRFYGFYDGQHLYVSNTLYQSGAVARKYVQVRHIGRYLLWIDNYLTAAEQATQIGLGATFGVLGALAATATADRHDCIALDMETGGVMLVDKARMGTLLAGHPDLLAEYEALPAKGNERRQIELLDKLNQRLK
ncbi:DUF6563 family protein [uncultured Fibrella sp.]|uniref:DUF6563 family protein n=1 Tax=uncultured Fibrella sp. TaxID=1284596 RepID=UPI0035C97F5F